LPQSEEQFVARHSRLCLQIRQPWLYPFSSHEAFIARICSQNGLFRP
jgi:hypothetical protein